jgi:hypothetical protein
VAEAGLLALATGLGQMHARTSGQEARYQAIRDALGPRPTLPPPWLDRTATRLHEWLAATVVAPDAGLEADLATLRAALTAPGPFNALTHGDPCLDNWIYHGDRLRLFDFEFSEFGHALCDGVYGRIHFPTCWCVDQIPYPIVLNMEAAYRAALIPGCPAAADDTLYHQAVVVGCAFHGINGNWWVPIARLMSEDIPGPEGRASIRARVLFRLTVLGRVTLEYRHLEALGATVRALVVRLRTLWPESTVMPYYPAFRGEFDG